MSDHLSQHERLPSDPDARDGRDGTGDQARARPPEQAQQSRRDAQGEQDLQREQAAQREQDAQREPDPQGEQEDPRIVVVTGDGMGVAMPSDQQGGDDRERTNPADLVEEPAKVMRIGSMIKQLLEEVRNAPLDLAGRKRLADIHHRSIEELKDGLAPELVDELDRIALPFSEESPSDPELRIAQAQLVGWLEGLFHGIQTALVAQQMAAQQQLQQIRALPPGAGASYGQPPGVHPGQQRHPGGEPSGPTGQYL